MKAKTSDVTSPQSAGASPSFLPSTPIDPRKRAEQVREKLVELIREGHLKDGEKLPTEPQLSAMFGVGRSSVREAVQSLIGLGLIEMRPGRGAYVRRLSLNDLVQMVDGAVRLEYGAALQLHEVRAMIEITAARLAATRRTDEDLTRMKDAIIRYRIADHANNPEGLIDADLGFHRAIVQAAHNEVLGKLLESISGLLREHRRQFGAAHELKNRPNVLAEHESILAALTSGVPGDAARLMQRHMRLIWRHIEHLSTKEDSDLASQSYLPMYDEEA